jgi:radical SAM protein with 4Fe4S-binding SPASM domain
MVRIEIIGRKIIEKLNPNLRTKLFYYFEVKYISIRRIMLHGMKDIPYNLSVETNSICTRKCHYCPRDTKRTAMLPIDTYFSILTQLREFGFKGRIGLYGYNEPLTDSRIFDFIKYTKLMLPLSEILLISNGDLLNQKKADKLLSAGVSELRINLHEPTTKEQEIKLKKIKSPIINFTDYRDKNRKTILYNRGGLLKFNNTLSIKSCINIFTLIIRANGDVNLCCQDVYGKYVYGNLKKQKLSDIWFHPKLKKLRKEIYKGKFVLPICKNCKYEIQPD